MNIEITVVCGILGAILGYLTYKKNDTKDIEHNASEKTLLSTKLDYISKGVDDIRLDIKAQDKSIKDLTVRLVKCEESTKSAHHRLDTLEKIKGDVTNEK